jgi:hypothetical protein
MWISAGRLFRQLVKIAVAFIGQARVCSLMPFLPSFFLRFAADNSPS